MSSPANLSTARPKVCPSKPEPTSASLPGKTLEDELDECGMGMIGPPGGVVGVPLDTPVFDNDKDGEHWERINQYLARLHTRRVATRTQTRTRTGRPRTRRGRVSALRLRKLAVEKPRRRTISRRPRLLRRRHMYIQVRTRKRWHPQARTRARTCAVAPLVQRRRARGRGGHVRGVRDVPRREVRRDGVRLWERGPRLLRLRWRRLVRCIRRDGCLRGGRRAVLVRVRAAAGAGARRRRRCVCLNLTLLVLLGRTGRP